MARRTSEVLIQGPHSWIPLFRTSDEKHDNDQRHLSHIHIYIYVCVVYIYLHIYGVYRYDIYIYTYIYTHVVEDFQTLMLQTAQSRFYSQALGRNLGTTYSHAWNARDRANITETQHRGAAASGPRDRPRCTGRSWRSGRACRWGCRWRWPCGPQGSRRAPGLRL